MVKNNNVKSKDQQTNKHKIKERISKFFLDSAYFWFSCVASILLNIIIFSANRKMMVWIDSLIESSNDVVAQSVKFSFLFLTLSVFCVLYYFLIDDLGTDFEINKKAKITVGVYTSLVVIKYQPLSVHSNVPLLSLMFVALIMFMFLKTALLHFVQEFKENYDFNGKVSLIISVIAILVSLLS